VKPKHVEANKEGNT